MTKSRFENYLRNKVCALVHENWTIYECAKQFGVDYKNMCSYMSGRKDMPIKLCFSILDYLDCNVVVFRKK